MTQKDKVTQTNAAAAEESASASEELTAQAATLRELVSDLQTLVTGDGSGGQRQVVHARTYRASGAKPTTYRPALGASKKKKPEDEIPLESGFKDF